MTYQIFQYRLPIDGQPDALNDWLASQRVVAVTQHLATTPAGPLLVFIVESAGQAAPKPPDGPKIDYKEKLGAEDFAVFSRLRELRKDIAEKEGIPVYAVFSNAQLAGMVERKATTPADLALIEGVGKARIDKHGEAFLAILRDNPAPGKGAPA